MNRQRVFLLPKKQQLFAMVRKLSAQGKVIIFVSHKLEEVESLCSQIAVFRQGKNVGQVKPPYDTDTLVEMMFGKKLKQNEKSCESQEDVNIEVTDLQIDDVRLPIQDVSFSIQRGEVIGLGGYGRLWTKPNFARASGDHPPCEGTYLALC